MPNYRNYLIIKFLFLNKGKLIAKLKEWDNKSSI